MQSRAFLVHKRPGALHGVDIVVVTQARVAGQASGRALMATVHGHQVDVDVNHQVAFSGPSAELHVFTVRGLAQYHHAVRIFGVVVVEATVGSEGVVHPVAHRVA